MYDSEKAWNDLINWVPEEIVWTPDICYLCGEEIAPDLTAIYSTGFGLWRHTSCDRIAMFYALKDGHGQYIHRSSTFSGGYYPMYTDDIKYARLWDEEKPALKCCNTFNRYLDKKAEKNEISDVYASKNTSLGWHNATRVVPTKVSVVKVGLSEIP